MNCQVGTLGTLTANPRNEDDNDKLRPARWPAVDPRHLLVIGAGPGLGGAIAHRLAPGGYHLTLLARRTDGLAKLADDPADAGTVATDASDLVLAGEYAHG